jgi:hypothetical protein
LTATGHHPSLIGLCGREEKAEATLTFDRRAASCPLFRMVGA